MPNRRLLLVPGLLSDRGLWQGVVSALPTWVQCWIPDHGTHSSIAAMAQSALQHAPTERFWLAGHSMGGRVALEMFRQAPERIEGLALMATGWTPLAAGERGESERGQRHALLDLARHEGMRAAGRRWATGMVHPQQLDSPMFESLLAMVERCTIDIFEAQVRALLTRPDATSLLAQIAVPTIVIAGRQDLWSPVEQHESLAAQIRTARLCVIEGSAHMVPMEQPDATADELVRWMKSATP